MTFSDEELDRYARHIVLKEVGGAGQARIAAASVAVIGCGGIGAPAIQYLAAAGVGRLILIDDDRVELSNLQRQVIFGTPDQGRAKVDAAATAISRLNPHVTVEQRPIRLHVDNAAALIDAADVVLDGSDNFTTRLAVADAALAARVPLVSAAVGQFEGQLATYRGWEADKPCYRCLVGADPDRDEASCAELGVLGVVTGVIGSLAALEALRAVVGFGFDPAGSLLLIDMLAMRFRTVRLPKDANCPVCAQKS